MAPGTFTPDGKLGADDVVPTFETVKQLATSGGVSMDCVVRQNMCGPLHRRQ
jgi:hypothetical protein